MELPGKRKRGRPKRRFIDAVRKDMTAVDVTEEDAEERADLRRRKRKVPRMMLFVFFFDKTLYYTNRLDTKVTQIKNAWQPVYNCNIYVYCITTGGRATLRYALTVTFPIRVQSGAGIAIDTGEIRVFTVVAVHHIARGCEHTKHGDVTSVS